MLLHDCGGVSALLGRQRGIVGLSQAKTCAGMPENVLAPREGGKINALDCAALFDFSGIFNPPVSSWFFAGQPIQQAARIKDLARSTGRRDGFQPSPKVGRDGDKARGWFCWMRDAR